jgi:CO/xanthine dehydrogenase FAD-binding subunit
MKPPHFEYVTPADLSEAVTLLNDYDGEAKILAGGQSLAPLLNMRFARPGLLIDIARIPDLDYVRKEGNEIVVGAMARQRAVEFADVVRNDHPFLHAATMYIAHPQNRNQGTLCGSVAHADPAAEYPALATALNATMKVVGPDGEREIPADEFFITFLTTSMDFGEILTEVRFPILGANVGWSIQEVARRHGDFALTGSMATVELEASGHIKDARIVLFGVDATSLRAPEAEAMLKGEKPTPELLEQAGLKAIDAIDEPLSDVHATAEFRRHLAGVLSRRALTEAVTRAGA